MQHITSCIGPQVTFVIGITGVVNDWHIRIDGSGIARSHRYPVVNIVFPVSAKIHHVGGQLSRAIKTDIQTSQMINAVQQIAVTVFVIAAAARGTAGGRTGGRHQVFAQGSKEVRTGDFDAVHLEGGHLFLGVGGVEVLQLKGGSVLEGQDKIVATTGQRGFVGGKFKNKTGTRITNNSLGSTRSRPGESDISHVSLLKGGKQQREREN